MRPRILATTSLFVVSLVACGQREKRQDPGNPPPSAAHRDRALSAAMARGDSVLAAGDTTEARMVYRVIIAFDSMNVEAVKRFMVLPYRPLAVTADEGQRVNQVSLAMKPDHWCKFPTPTDSELLVDIEMLSDIRLLPKLRSARVRAQSGKCEGTNAFLLVGQPTATITEVRDRYGAPHDEVKNSDGSVVLTYGSFRIFGDKAGNVMAVVM